MFEFCQVTKRFKTDFWEKSLTVLDGISFKVEEEKLTGFLGANGAGKTTSMKILMNFIRPNQGSVEYSDKLGSNQREVFSQIGYLPERPYFYPHLTGREFLEYMGRLNLVDKVMIVKRMIEWSERLSIAHALDRKVRGYSKGMLQRLGFISTLIHDPSVLIFDEPLSGLDPVGRKELKNSIKDLSKRGKTIFFSSHIVSDIQEVCDNVVVLEDGRLFYQGGLECLLRLNNEIEYKIEYAERESFKSEIVLAEGKKSDFLKDIINQGGDIISVKQKQPSLEEIIYKIKR